MSSPAPAGLREKFMVLQCYTIIELGLKNSLPVSPQRFQIGVLRHDGKKQKCLGYQSAANFTEKSRQAKGFTLALSFPPLSRRPGIRAKCESDSQMVGVIHIGGA